MNNLSDILSKLNPLCGKGPLLELVVEDILNDSHYSNVKRQNSGSQYGFDLVGYNKDGERWKFECKNLRKKVGINDITPKLLWHTGGQALDGFVIIAPNGYSNDVQKFLEEQLFSFPIEIWHSDYLEKRISESPRALERLKISYPITIKESAVPIVFKPSEIRFNVVYHEGEPFSIDYFHLNNEVIKSYTENNFEVLATIANPTKENATIQKINVKTINYTPIEGRVLRQYKQKGLVEPLKVSFSLKDYPFGSNCLLDENKIIELKAGSTEYLRFILDKKVKPGFYEFIFEVIVAVRNRSITVNSCLFRLNVMAEKNNMVSLCVIGQYYDSPVTTLLKLNEVDWKTIQSAPDNTIAYLGYTIFDLPEFEQPHETWKIKQISGKRNKNELTLENQTPKVLLDLNILISERILTVNDIIVRTSKISK